VCSSDLAEALSALMTLAVGEYAVGVPAGGIKDVIEYQDAWGFLRAADAMFTERRADFDAIDAEAATELAARLAEAQAAFPSPEPVDPPALSDIRAATTQITLALYAFR